MNDKNKSKKENRNQREIKSSNYGGGGGDGGFNEDVTAKLLTMMAMPSQTMSTVMGHNSSIMGHYHSHPHHRHHLCHLQGEVSRHNLCTLIFVIQHTDGSSS